MAANETSFKPGESGNPAGRPKGQRNYGTIQVEAVKSLGKKLGKTPEQIEEELIQNGLLRAYKGDYRYYKDILDRMYGTAQMMSRMEHSVEVQVDTSTDFDELINEAVAILKKKKLSCN